jgi:hypothetical protein
MIKKIMFILLTMWLLPPAFSGIAHAIAIQFEVEDLPDATPGEDLQQYAYTVSDQTFNAEQGFTSFLTIRSTKPLRTHHRQSTMTGMSLCGNQTSPSLILVPTTPFPSQQRQTEHPSPTHLS